MKASEYVKLPYKRIVWEAEDVPAHRYHGRILEVSECRSTGATLEELDENLSDALEGILEIMLQDGDAVPMPLSPKEEDYSGKFLVRIPRSLHSRLAMEAKEEGVSLNQFVAYKLARNL